MTDTPLWERGTNESARAYEAFVVYRDMGAARSLEKVQQKLDKSTTMLGRWSGEHNWQARVRAYDDYIDAKARAIIDAQAVEQRVAMLKRHADMGRAMQSKGIEYLVKNGVDNSASAITATKTGIELERKSAGLPDYLLEIQAYSDDELKQRYAYILAQLGSDGSGDETAGLDAAAADTQSEDGDA